MSEIFKLKCINNFHMDDGDIAFVQGEVYDFYLDGGSYVTDKDAEGKKHWMELFDLLGYFLPVVAERSNER